MTTRGPLLMASSVYLARDESEPRGKHSNFESSNLRGRAGKSAVSSSVDNLRTFLRLFVDFVQQSYTRISKGYWIVIAKLEQRHKASRQLGLPLAFF